jgi:hypothetical protein
VTVLTVDLHVDLLTREEAAVLAGVSVEAVRKWATRGYLDQHGQRRYLPDKGRPGAPRHLGIDVLKAEAATRRRAGRRPIPLTSGNVHVHSGPQDTSAPSTLGPPAGGRRVRHGQ